MKIFYHLLRGTNILNGIIYINTYINENDTLA